jgi:PAS domain S-box-containing protein
LVNTTLAKLFNTTPRQMIGKRRHEFMPNEDAERHESNDRKVIETGEMLEFEEYSHMEGHSITWLTKKFPLRDAQGAIYAVAGISADISERKRYEDQLQRLNETLEIKVMERTADLHAANQALAERAAQLRQLAGELTTAEQRERRCIAKLLHDGLQQYLVAAQLRQGILIDELGEHEGGQTAREVEGLLTESIKVSRSLATELCPPVLDGGILAGFEWLTRFMAARHGLDVDLIVETGAPILPEDVKIFLFESVRELLLNVVKHSQARSAKVHLREAGTELLVTVSDSGSGFDPSALERRDIAGGFGLFSIRERIGLIGGAIEIDSAPGAGARFQLSVPFEKTAPVKVSAAAVPPAGNALAAPAERIRILLVDDHKVVREGLARILGAEPDFDIVGQAEDGNMAVELTEALRPSVVLMDINMPDMDGITATRILARQHPDVHVIGLSFYSAEERAGEMLEAGARMYVSKTAPAEELKAAIRSCVRTASVWVQAPPADDRPSPSVIPITRITRMQP